MSTCSTSGARVSSWPTMTSPVKPSMEIQSPSLTVLPPALKVRAAQVDVQLAAADDADLAHLPRDERGVARHAALLR